MALGLALTVSTTFLISCVTINPLPQVVGPALCLSEETSGSGKG